MVHKPAISALPGVFLEVQIFSSIQLFWIMIDPLTETVTEPVALLTTAVTLSVQNLDAVPGVVISDSETASGSIIKKYKSETE